MFRWGVLLAILQLIKNSSQTNDFPQESCVLENGLTNSLSVQSYKDENGEWTMSFSTCKAYDNSSKITRLDLKQTVRGTEHKVVQIVGVLGVGPVPLEHRKLRFSPKGGRLAVITDDGKTAFRDSAEKQKDYGSVFTNRPLKNNELFEVEVKRKISAFPGWPVGIGVTTHSPDTIEMPGWMGQMKSGTWMLYDTALQFNGKEARNNYGRGYGKLEPGDKIGVMRTQRGTLHFFVNGEDEGEAASGIPYPVYGVVDLIRNIPQVTIVDQS